MVTSIPNGRRWQDASRNDRHGSLNSDPEYCQGVDIGEVVECLDDTVADYVCVLPRRCASRPVQLDGLLTAES